MVAGERTVTRTAGYTLIELMIVVLIIGVLAAIAIPSFSSYMYMSKTSEATTFLGEIRQRQEAYRAEFGQYCNVSGAASTRHPAGTPTDQGVAWNPAPDAWNQLGARPDSTVRFRYSTVAGAPGTDPSCCGFGSALGYTGTDFWFVSQALGDLDNDDTDVLFESYSEAAGIYVNVAKGWE